MTANPKTLFARLVASQGVRRGSIELALKRVGQLIDLSGDFGRDDGTALALQWCHDLETRRLSPKQGALLEYFRANAWANRQRLCNASSRSIWQWEQPELQNEVLSLRRALTHPGFTDLGFRRCQILTNLGNQLSTLGRSADAQEYWQRALAIQPRFAMALGNRGNGLIAYSRSLYDLGHHHVFLLFAYDSLNAALAPNALWDGPYADARALFQEKKDSIERHINVEQVRASLNLDRYKLGRSVPEQAYRRWCLRHRLFLNPLNDLGAYPIAAQDVLMLPSYVTPIDEGPTLIGFFNQMKQEFASARWLLYEATKSDKVHFSDRRVRLFDTLDYPAYGLTVEEMKMAFRVAYSLFDKIAFFINDYLQLGIPEKSVYFRTIWFERITREARTLRPQFQNVENWPLRGLYWLAKDFSEEGFRDVMEPDAAALYEIRNHLEHKYLKLHDIFVPKKSDAKVRDRFSDRLAYSLSRSDFEAKTLRLLKLARAALIYLVLGMHAEEERRNKGKEDKLRLPRTLPILEDRFKR